MLEQHTTRPLQVRAYWGQTLLDAALVDAHRSITLGGTSPDPGIDLNVEADLPVGRFVLAHHRGDTADIIVPEGASVRIDNVRGARWSEVDLPPAANAPFPARLAQLQPGEHLTFDLGNLTFIAEYTDTRAELEPGSGIDWQFPRVLFGSLVVHAVAIAMAMVTPKELGLPSDALLRLNTRAAQVLLVPEREEPKSKLSLSGTKGSKHKDPEGRFGERNKPPRDALASKPGAPRVDPNRREKDRQIAMASGLVGALRSDELSGAVATVLGPNGLGAGINDALGGLKGARAGDAGGAGGLGSRGFRSGGGGNSLGIGGLGGGDRRGGGGPGNVELGGPGKSRTRIIPGRTIVTGSLKKDEISRVIRNNLARFKFCYERELNANPNLVGKVSVYFKIAPTGAVAEASVRDTSLHNTKVEACVTSVLKSLKFPAPRGGGIVIVTYPFIFST